ncbi:hypothetical protein M6D93_16855 [Jatrophihabitans telluris]|uniref:Flagellar FliJ protein n=1 Tax=Jatrophihabitans telluris TaxID=2038343 RepID=A0ABY4QYL4_9ACTN|nr:hypothetical protein [Jatrophihabitans telluris]UQX87954.1 hypothetical protein M6D93_16855 [Jatrophihabitans telluris]
MTTRRWLPVMVRAREAAEDAAAQRLAQARREAASAITAERAESSRLDGMTALESSSVQGFLAHEAARTAAAATYSATLQRVGFAQERVGQQVTELSAAARARRTVEKLSERVAAEAKAEGLARAQREADDTGASRFTARNNEKLAASTRLEAS